MPHATHISLARSLSVAARGDRTGYTLLDRVLGYVHAEPGLPESGNIYGWSWSGVVESIRCKDIMEHVH